MIEFFWESLKTCFKWPLCLWLVTAGNKLHMQEKSEQLLFVNRNSAKFAFEENNFTYRDRSEILFVLLITVTLFPAMSLLWRRSFVAVCERALGITVYNNCRNINTKPCPHWMEQTLSTLNGACRSQVWGLRNELVIIRVKLLKIEWKNY